MPHPPPWTVRSSHRSGYGPVKGISQLVREATDNGRTIIEGLVSIASDPDTANRDRVSAYQVLLDRGFGKAVETTLTLQADASGSEALSALADAELERLASTLGPSTVVPVSPASLPATRAVGAASAVLMQALELPEPPPEVLDPLAPPLDPVTQGNGSDTPPPVTPLPAPRPRRRVVVPPPAVRRTVSSDDATGPADGGEGTGPKDGEGGG